MASLLRQIVAGPRSRHPEAGLDLCYVTSQIIATSGPSGTYPQRAYRNPLDQLVAFLDKKHGEDWAIWEFRAEGTGYPDSEVYGRVWHYPWPDHHPPPFKLVPMIMAGMRNWLQGEGGEKKEGRVVVVHCKAGKGRSGTMACSYLISECGWTPEDALARFTERRMRPGFGQGVSIPSQLRWVGYVDQWTKGGKIYVERQIEIMEVHVWGLRDGVKVQVEGFVDEGKTIKLFHVFTKKERVVVDDTSTSSVVRDTISGVAGVKNQGKVPEFTSPDQLDGSDDKSLPSKSKTIDTPANVDGIADSKVEGRAKPPQISRTAPSGTITPLSTKSKTSDLSSAEDQADEAGGGAVIFRPSTRVILPTSDVNLDFERRNKATMGYTMVTAVAHVWFNTYFEGNGPKQGGKADESGVFEIEWDKMDGLKGSSRKGTRAFDRLAVVWKVYKSEPGRPSVEQVIAEPAANEPVQQMAAADWKGGNHETPQKAKNLGLRTESPSSADHSKASSVTSSKEEDEEEDDFNGVKSSSPEGGEFAPDTETKGPKMRELVNQKLGASQTAPEQSQTNTPASLDTASSTTPHTSSQSPDSDKGVIGGIASIATSKLPGGVPEEEMKDAHEHKLGHLGSLKKNVNS